MSNYRPETWVVLEFTGEQFREPMRKVFAGWYGGFAGSDSWKLNSGIAKTTKVDEFYEFEGYSGSVYVCHPNNYRMSGLQHCVLNHWKHLALENDGPNIRILDLEEVAEL